MTTSERHSGRISSGHEQEEELANGVVLIAASAGGVEATRDLLSALPESLPAAFLLVQHRTPWKERMLAAVLQRSTNLHAKMAEEGEALCNGVLYIAPPDRWPPDLTCGRSAKLPDAVHPRHASVVKMQLVARA